MYTHTHTQVMKRVELLQSRGIPILSEEVGFRMKLEELRRCVFVCVYRCCVCVCLCIYIYVCV